MNHPALSQLIVTDDGSSTLRHPIHQETYHSTFGALTEANCVFLQNSGVLARLQAGTPSRVLEIGFGTGLNFMVSAAAADAVCCPLDYVAVENNPLADTAFSTLLTRNFPQQQHLTAKSIDAVKAYKNRALNKNNTTIAADEIELTDNIKFRLIIDNALTANFGIEKFDAVYLDAFSPKHNPTLWAAPFLKKLRNVLAEDARLASYCVSRLFRDGLNDAGYKWQKVKGPPGKREVLIANPH